MRGNSAAQKGAACSLVALWVRGAMRALPTASSRERKTHSSEGLDIQILGILILGILRIGHTHS